MEKYCDRCGNLMKGLWREFRVSLEKNCFNDYLLDRFIADISNEVEKICEEFARRGMLDEFSDGSFLDTFIAHKYEIVRNDLRRQHFREMLIKAFPAL